MHVNEMLASKYLKASDFPEPAILTVRSIESEPIKDQKTGRMVDKFILHFEEETRGLVLNKVNPKAIAKIYGPDTEKWIGKKLTLFATEVDFGGDMVEAIRVRAPKPAPARPPVREAENPADGMDDDIPF